MIGSHMYKGPTRRLSCGSFHRRFPRFKYFGGILSLLKELGNGATSRAASSRHITFNPCSSPPDNSERQRLPAAPWDDEVMGIA